jgi:rfaE bifunctional protein kinase chain/domain
MLFDIKEISENLKNLRVAVIGDYCLDQHWYMDSKFDKKLDYNDDTTFALTDIIYSPGGAGNVANNFVKLGVNVKCIGIIGDDGNGYQLMKCLKNIGADTKYMLKTKEKETHTCIRSTRITGDRKIKLNEIITSKFAETSKKTENYIKNKIKQVINEVDAFVLVEQFDDNNKGIFTDDIRKEIIELSEMHNNKIFIADSRKYIDKYENMFLKCNRNEFIETLNINEFNESCLVGVNEKLTNFKTLFITRGEDGMTLIDNKNNVNNVPAIKINREINTCGAGDSATAGIVVGLYSNYDIKESALLGNIMASIAIKDLESTGYPTYEKIVETLKINNLIK